MNLGLEFLYIKSIVVSVDGGSMYVHVEFTFLQEYLFLMVDMLLNIFSICAWEIILHSDIGVFYQRQFICICFRFGENCFSGLRLSVI